MRSVVLTLGVIPALEAVLLPEACPAGLFEEVVLDFSPCWFPAAWFGAMSRHGFNRGSVRQRALHPAAPDRGSVRGDVHGRGSPRPAASHWYERTTGRELPPIGWRIGAGRRVTPFEPAVSWPL